MGTILLIISSSIGLFFMLCFNLHLALGFDICPDLSCGSKIIRFPFKIKGKTQQHCGYPGFDLVCTANNEIVMELPSSVKLSVKDIDYKMQTIVLHDTHECLISQIHKLTLVSSNFQFIAKTSKDYNFFNCSLGDRDLYSYYMVPCLTTTNSQLYAIPSNTMIESMSLSLCTKMFNISSFPLDFLGKDNTLELLWSEPNCKDCESNRNRCGWKNYGVNNETQCIVNHKGSSKKVPVTTGSVLGSLFVIFLVCAVYHFYDSYTLRKEKQAIFDKFLEDYEALKPTRYSYAELKRITNNFADKLGEGAYGVVFKGSVSKEFIVAVKMLNNSQGNGDEFINEVSTMGRIHHVNIVRMIGFCADGFRRALIYEFMPNGSLKNFKNSPNNKKSFLGWQKLHEITLGIAKGIEYLHQGCDQRIVHFDIKPQNVLLDNNFTPKICDFGLSKLCSKEQSLVSMTTARGTLGYIAPEVFSRNFGSVSYKSDIYSYGMMMLETIGGGRSQRTMRRTLAMFTTRNGFIIF